jgi:hypothetical protein
MMQGHANYILGSTPVNYQIMPPVDNPVIKTVLLNRDQTGSLGFSLRGGVEHGVGHFVSSVDHGSHAELQGLEAGDQLIRVDRLPLATATHKEAVSLISSRWKVCI